MEDMSYDKSYNMIRDFLRKHGSEVIYAETVNGETVRKFEHPHPPLKAMAHKLMLFAETVVKERDDAQLAIRTVTKEKESIFEQFDAAVTRAVSSRTDFERAYGTSDEELEELKQIQVKQLKKPQ